MEGDVAAVKVHSSNGPAGTRYPRQIWLCGCLLCKYKRLDAKASDLEPAGDSPAVGWVLDLDGETEQVPERSESSKQWKAKAGVNLRKSLAWDNTFFTSEGVLNTEELAIVNNTFRKVQGSRLPGITEETRRSGESTNSTLESKSWMLESLEIEQFDIVHASIKRTLGKPNKALGVIAATSKNPNPKATTNVPRGAARKGVDRMPQSKNVCIEGLSMRRSLPAAR